MIGEGYVPFSSYLFLVSRNIFDPEATRGGFPDLDRDPFLSLLETITD